MLRKGMLLYHGSYAAVNEIRLDMCAKGKDFGKGFYLTDNEAQAKSFIKNSIKKAYNAKKIHSGVKYGYVTTFRYTPNQENVPIYVFDTTGKEWLWFVSMNRRSQFADILKTQLMPELTNAEIIVGKIANDTTNPTIMAYMNGLYGDIMSESAVNFAISQLLPDRLKWQYCFLTEKAISCLEMVEVNKYDV